MAETGPRTPTVDPGLDPNDPANWPSVDDWDRGPYALPDGPLPIDGAGDPYASRTPDTAPSTSNPAETGRRTTSAEAADKLAEAEDAKARYTDAELLGGSYKVRLTVHEAGTKSIKMWQGMKAKLRNAVATPGKIVKQFAFNRAKASYDRKEKRLNDANNERLRERRRVQAVDAKIKMEERAGVLNDHKLEMRNRTHRVEQNAAQRRYEYVSELKGKRENALARKALRHQLRQDGASRRERRAILGDIDSDQLQQIGKVAIVAETSRRRHTSAGAAAEMAAQKKQKHEERGQKAADTYQERSENIDAAMQNAEQLRGTHIPDAEQRLEQATAELENMNPDDPQYAEAEEHVKLAQRRVTMLNRQLRGLVRSTKVGNFRNRVTQAWEYANNDAAAEYGDELKTATQQKETRGRVNEVHQGQLQDELEVVLNQRRRR
jgi:hypothetical protein